jgi:hypothetical protein
VSVSGSSTEISHRVLDVFEFSSRTTLMSALHIVKLDFNHGPRVPANVCFPAIDKSVSLIGSLAVESSSDVGLVVFGSMYA